MGGGGSPANQHSLLKVVGTELCVRGAGLRLGSFWEVGFAEPLEPGSVSLRCSCKNEAAGTMFECTTQVPYKEAT